MMMRLGEVQLLLERLDELHQLAKSTVSHETIRIDAPGGTSTLVGAGDARTLLDAITTGTQSYETLVSSLRGLAGIFYPIEDLDYTEPLGYYQQREWRIIANLMWKGEPVTRELTDDEKSAAVAIDDGFFEREEDFRTGRYRIVDQCRALPSLAGHHALAFAERLIVPNGVGADAAEILAESALDIPVTESPD